MDANESPYDLPEKIKEKTFARLRRTPYNRYPQADSRRLKGLLADYLKVGQERLIVGNGSDEIINYLISACVSPGDRVVFPHPSFSMYRILAEVHNAEVVTAPLDDNWGITDRLLEAAGPASLVFLGYPNNPTGNCFSRKKINELRETTEGLVVLDEAYFEFSGKTFIDEVKKDAPLVVLRTLSKGFGLAGIRTGILIAPPSLVEGIQPVKLPYNLNRLSQVTAEETLKNRCQVFERVEKIKEETERIFSFLAGAGFNPYPTAANFVLFNPSEPQKIYDRLLDEGIRIRRFSDPPLSGCLRVTTGTTEENNHLINCLETLK